MALAVTDYAGHEIKGVILYAADGSVLIGQKASAASLPIVPASDIPDPTYIGDIKFGEALPAGTNVIGKVGIDQTTQGTTNKITLFAKGLASGDTELKSTGGGGELDTNLVRWQGSAVSSVISPAEDDRDCGSYTPPLAALMYMADTGDLLWDRARGVASTGAGKGVLQVGTLGELITLATSAARTANGTATAVTGLGWRKKYVILVDLTAAATNAADTCDVYVDVSLDGTTWLNAIHFTTMLGNGGAKQFFASLDGGTPPATDIAVDSDAAAGVVRPTMAGLPQMRARWEIADGGGGVQSFTFSVKAWAI